MALFSFTLSEGQFRQLLNEHRQALETERQRHAALIARLDAIFNLFNKQSADAEMAEAARVAKPIIDETVAALDRITPEP